MDRVIVMICMGLCALGGFFVLPDHSPEKIKGISLEASRDSTAHARLPELYQQGAGWVAIIPFAFSAPGNPQVSFNHQRQWWGESIAGVRQTIADARQAGLRVMVKPHVWVRGDGWPGDYSLENDSLWSVWENEYALYILAFAEAAESEKAEMFCIGTEFRIAARERPAYWEDLADKVREVYSGKVTYAANWDNFENITFWNKLDYIGIDAYFPLSESRVPEVRELEKSWKVLGRNLENFSRRYNRKILFTEFGYRSTEYTADGHWKHPLEGLQPNNQAQVNGYQAVFNSIWQEPYVAGGFLWKWHLSPPRRTEMMTKAYSPQGKPAQQVILNFYSNQ